MKYEPNIRHEVAKHIAAASARIAAGILYPATRKVLVEGAEAATKITREALRKEENGDDNTDDLLVIDAMNQDLVALGVFCDVLRMSSFEEFHKAQARLRSLMAFTKEECELLMTPADMTGIVAMVHTLHYAADVMDRIVKVLLAEQMAMLAPYHPNFTTEDCAVFLDEHRKIKQDTEEWVKEGQSSMDEYHVTQLFHEVGLRKEANPDA